MGWMFAKKSCEKCFVCISCICGKSIDKIDERLFLYFLKLNVHLIKIFKSEEVNYLSRVYRETHVPLEIMQK